MLKGIFLIAIIGVLVWLGYLEDQNRLFNTATSTQVEISNKDERVNEVSNEATKAADTASEAISDENKQHSDEPEAITAETVNDAADDASDAVVSVNDTVEHSIHALAAAPTTATDSVAESVETASEAVESTVESAVETAAEKLPAEPLSLSGLSRKIGSAIGSTSGLISGVSDEASAAAALPKLAEISESLSEAALQIPNIPDAAKAPLAKLINGGIDKIKPLTDKALGLPGVGDILNPVIGPMMETLTKLSQ